MKSGKTYILFFILIGVSIGAASSQSSRKGENFGLGIILGEPTGISAKVWLSETNAFDLATGWNLRQNTFYVHMDYIIHFYRISTGNGPILPMYTGFGPKLDIVAGAADPFRIGIRVPIGVAAVFRGTPLEIFLELAPTVLLIPLTALDFGGGFGIRFYF